MTELQHNVYFDGRVQSVGFTQQERRLSVGVIAPGEYHFGTDAPERMSVTAGELFLKAEDGTWQGYPAGTAFEVPGSSGFDVRADQATGYLCEYL